MAEKSSITAELNNIRRPAYSPENQESLCISLAYDLAEKKLRDGTASSQLICTFLELGNTKEKLKVAELEAEIKLKEEKAKSIATLADYERTTREAIEAMRRYSGSDEQ